MEAIILAGGFGTRLSHLVSNVPKPMAPINGEPFLKYILEYLLKNGVRHTVLAVGYKAEVIKDYFGGEYKGIKITYSTEDKPLGTGGAIKKAIRCCNGDDVFILNGDTYFDTNLIKMKKFHEDHDSKLTVSVKALFNFDRYGLVIVEDNIVKEFKEKKPTVYGKINGGTYILNKEIFNLINEEAFSFEKVILESRIIKVNAYESEGYFIDIGVPGDYYKAQEDLKIIQEKW